LVETALVDDQRGNSLLLPCCVLDMQEAQQERLLEVQEDETSKLAGKRRG
jgi:hypothetical protein